MSFLGGAAEQLTEVIETREKERMYDERMERASERELSTFEKKQKMQADREASRQAASAKKQAEEYASFLKSLGYTNPQATSILSGGVDSVNYHSGLATTARQKGIDIQTLMGETSVAIAEPTDSLTADSTSSQLTGEIIESMPTLQADLEAISAMYDEGEDTYDTIQKAYEAYEQKHYNETNPTKKSKYRLAADHFKNLINEQLEENAARNNEKDTKFDTAITKFYNQALNNAANTVDMEGVMEDGIFKLIKGSKAQRNISILMAAQEMQTFNQIYDDEGKVTGEVKSLNLQEKLKNDVMGAVKKLQSYALQEVDFATSPDAKKDKDGKVISKVKNTMATPIPIADLQKEAYKYNYGDIIFVQDASGNTSVRVYTGLNLSTAHNMFVNAGNVNG